jgi:hypothetical protein
MGSYKAQTSNSLPPLYWSFEEILFGCARSYSEGSTQISTPQGPHNQGKGRVQICLLDKILISESNRMGLNPSPTSSMLTSLILPLTCTVGMKVVTLTSHVYSNHSIKNPINSSTISNLLFYFIFLHKCLLKTKQFGIHIRLIQTKKQIQKSSCHFSPEHARKMLT